MNKPVPVGEETTPLSANGFMFAACGDGIRLLAFWTQHWPGRGYLTTKAVADIMLTASIAKELYAELGRNLERHERMFGPILSREYIDKAWADVVAPELTENGEEKGPATS